MIPYFLSPESHIIMSRHEAEWMETILLLGAICGLPLTAFSVDRIGRKMSILLSCSVLIVTWIVIALANQIGYIYGARFFQGIGLNMAFVAAPMYVGEISHKSIRGFLSSLIYVMSLFGVVVIYTIVPLLPFYVPSLIAIAILASEIIAFSFLPESPYFLIAKGRHEQAATSLRKFRKCFDVDKELIEMKQGIESDNKEKLKFQEVFQLRNYRRALIIMVILNGGQLFNGFEVILMNLHDILTAAGSVYIGASSAAITFSTINIIFSIAASILVDKFGRKKLLIISTFSTGICLFGVAIYFHLKQLGFETVSYSWIPVVSIMTYAAVFKFGLGTVPIVMTSEVFASKIKAFGMTFSDGVYIVSSILVLQIFFLLRDMFGMYVSFYLFALSNILTLVCVLYFVPETKGRSLEEIQEVLKR